MNINVTPDVLARVAVQGLRLNPPPTEEEINQILKRLAVALEVQPDDVAKTRELLRARFANRMIPRQMIND